MMEFIVCLGTMLALVTAGNIFDRAGQDGKLWNILVNTSPPHLVRKFPGLVSDIFDSLFGKNFFSRGCFCRSVTISLVAAILFLPLIILNDIFQFYGPDMNILEQIDNQYTKLSTQERLLNGLILPFTLLLNSLVDYLSLLKTRLLVRAGVLASHQTYWFGKLLAIAVVDLVLLLVILFVAGLLAMGLLCGFHSYIGTFGCDIGNFPRMAKDPFAALLLIPYVLTTLLWSAGVLFFIFSAFLSCVVARFLSPIDTFIEGWILGKNHPYLRLAINSAIALGFFWFVSIFF